MQFKNVVKELAKSSEEIRADDPAKGAEGNVAGSNPIQIAGEMTTHRDS